MNMDKIKSIIVEIEKIKNSWDYKKAEEIVENALIKYSDDYRLYEEIADINLYNGNFNKAEKAINFALELNSISATWNYLKGFLLLSQDKIKEALKYLKKSNELMWNNSEVLRNLGWAYTLIWETSKWIAILKRALNLSPWDELIKEDLAMALIWAWEVETWNNLLKELKKKK
jgi:tetratricopeptide (TPR) repeat protein